PHGWRGFARPAWLLGVLAMGVVCLVAYFAFRGSATASEQSGSSASQNSTEWYRVEKRSFDLTVTESGDLDAFERLEIKSRVDGRPEIIYLVDEGATVKKD